MNHTNTIRRDNATDLNRSISALNSSFRYKTRSLQTSRVATKGTPLHELQVDFSYLMHELEMGYKHRRFANINKVNDFLSNI